MGLGFVLSFGYWCTDFLVIQRAMAANSMSAARSVPLIASVPKMLFPLLVILPGLIALALTSPVTQNAASADQPIQSPQALQIQSAQKGLIPPQTNPETGEVVKDKSGKVVLDYNMVIPNMLLHYFPSGMLGLGLTALLASFMSGMAGNVTAFNTVWTYDIFKAYIRRDATDASLLLVGQLATFFGVPLDEIAIRLKRKFFFPVLRHASFRPQTRWMSRRSLELDRPHPELSSAHRIVSNSSR